ncbi:Peroxisomal acyl-coenzyme A oxidase 3 [Tupaia chinensis]|uniref:Acyl-coenzyme A oxidase n=1 Tax=Tupaia chinensis TaxID=246437 RepID=L9KNP0_TUPCH|nr:Peroxisomal acyl-coenzyme A oxidase 3 [Tupaia chinensis]
MAPTLGGDEDALLPDFPRGPLHAYRARASFSWKELLLFLEGQDTLRFKKSIFSALEKDPLFARTHGAELSMEKYRELTFLRCKRVMEYDFLSVREMFKSPLKTVALIHCLGMYDWSLAAKYLLHVLEFILHSPDFEAAKFWVGNMGKTATHAVVFAQLYTPGGQCHGLHSFVVQIRDPNTLLPMPGVMVGDIGKKLGQNGLDNGFAMFHKVRVPRKNLLDRTGGVTPEGTYVTPFKDVRQRFGASLGSLSFGRVSILSMSVANLKLAVSIALRFSATRCQFGPTDEEEVPVLEYQMQQWRLLPYLAAAYALDHFSKSLFLDLMELQRSLLGGERNARQAELGREIHALASAGKPLASWTAQQGIQECREACGGHGYLAMNRIGELRNDNDPNCTYEGDNNVLLQQTSNYLLGLLTCRLQVNRIGELRNDNDPNCTYEGDNNVLLQQTSNYLLGLLTCRLQDGAPFQSPLKTVNFLEAYPDILGQRFTGHSVADCLDSAVSLQAYQWLVCYLLQESYRKLDQEKRSGRSDFEARNNCQVFRCRPLALAFLELTVVHRFHEHTHGPSVPPSLRGVLGRLSALYALWSLSRHTAVLYQGGYFSGTQAGAMMEQAMLDLCSQLKDDAVALVDVLAPPDFVLDSPIGRADGESSGGTLATGASLVRTDCVLALLATSCSLSRWTPDHCVTSVVLPGALQHQGQNIQGDWYLPCGSHHHPTSIPCQQGLPRIGSV